VTRIFLISAALEYICSTVSARIQGFPGMEGVVGLAGFEPTACLSNLKFKWVPLIIAARSVCYLLAAGSLVVPRAPREDLIVRNRGEVHKLLRDVVLLRDRLPLAFLTLAR
jgi:hypothetical protein